MDFIFPDVSGKKCYFVVRNVYLDQESPNIELLGEYEATLDAKGRFLLPAALKKQLPEGEGALMICRGLDKNLTLYPKAEWTKVAARVRKLNDFKPKVRQFKTVFFGGSNPVSLDSAGRMLIPPSLREYADLEKDIVLVGEYDHVRIWSPAALKKSLEAAGNDPSGLAEEVLGGDDAPLDFG